MVFQASHGFRDFEKGWWRVGSDGRFRWRWEFEFIRIDFDV